MRVPGYTEIRELGHGGAGRVVLALRDADRLPVAIKHLSDPGLIQRFRTEAALIADLDSPHIARLMEYVEGEDGAAIVMELVDGVTLRHLLSHEGATGPEAALTVLKGALLGLAEAHRAGVVHRDFKPENVIVTGEGDSRLVDFGVAAHAGEPGPPAGTPSYMAPEQWDDAPASPSTDVYAATVVFYECLTGRRPFDGATMAALAYQHQHLSPPLEDVDDPVRALVEHGMAKDPAARPASAEAFIAELETAAAAAYGEDWQQRGRTGLAVLTLPFTALFPLAGPAAETSSTLAQTALAPVGKLAVTAAVTVATIAAVLATFAIWRDPPTEPLSRQPGPARTAALPALPSETAEPTSPAPTSLAPTRPGEAERLTEPRQNPANAFTRPPPVADQPSPEPSATRTTPALPPTRTPEPGPTRARATPPPADTPAPEPPAPGTPAPDPGDPDPGDPDPGDPGQEEPGPGDPGPGAPSAGRGPILSAEVSVSVNVPLLSGEGDGLVGADLGVKVGSSLLGGAAFPGALLPGVLLLGRRLVVARRLRTRGGAPSGRRQGP
ncbi:protein kinase [Nonomuraea mangrovi]|uniref:non-specific serine/threonine protein kinase n=1 Tax=Nonomuraea mangrovi TaxID=2316207 RepID=A0ABW4TD54_9ACTN